MFDRRADLSFALLVFVVGLLVAVAAQFISLGTISDPIGPRGLPTAIGVFFMIAGATLVAMRLRAWNPAVGNLVATEGKEDDDTETPPSLRRVAIVVVLAVGFAFALMPLGFIISTLLFVTGLLLAMGIRPWWKAAIGGVACSLICYVVFAILLSVRLPAGLLSGLLRALGLPS